MTHPIKSKYLTNVYTNIIDSVPNDHSRQTTAEDYIKYLLKNKKIGRLLDLGCGDGNSLDYFEHHKDICWFGLDIGTSPESKSQKRDNGHFVIYDGTHIPFADETFDTILSIQALEHTLQPRTVFQEIYRILKPGGYFIGSTSHLEPYHSYSFFNYTPYAFKSLIEEANLKLSEIRPSIDAITLIARKLFKNNKFFDRYWNKESPLNKVINLEGKFCKRSAAEINLIKLVFCGQFSFLVVKE